MGDWQSAITLNQMLLQENPDDIDTLNRLAFALASTGNSKEAKEIYQKVLQLDIQNPIAMRNLRRMSSNAVKPTVAGAQAILMNNIFIEEPGRTKVVDLINVAEQKLISQLRSGETLLLSVKRMRIFAQDMNKQYIGMLPDDLSKRLIKFINGGNRYEAYVKNVENHKVIIFIKETKRSLRFKNQPSFASFEKSKFSLKNGHELKIHKDSHATDEDESRPDTTDDHYSL